MFMHLRVSLVYCTRTPRRRLRERVKPIAARPRTMSASVLGSGTRTVLKTRLSYTSGTIGFVQIKDDSIETHITAYGPQLNQIDRTVENGTDEITDEGSLHY